MYSHTSSCLAVGSGDSSAEARKALIGCVIQEPVRVFCVANELTAGKEDDGLALMTHVSMCGDKTDILLDSF